VLDYAPDDIDAWKYLAEQHLVLADRENMEELVATHAQAALDAARGLERSIGKNGDDARAEALLLQGRASLKTPNSKREAKEIAKQGADLGRQLDDTHLGAQLFELLGDASLALGHWGEAETAYKLSYDGFRSVPDAERTSIVERKLSKTRGKEQDAAMWPWPFPARRSGRSATTKERLETR
jgi:hypothetical protein